MGRLRATWAPTKRSASLRQLSVTEAGALPDLKSAGGFNVVLQWIFLSCAKPNVYETETAARKAPLVTPVFYFSAEVQEARNLGQGTAYRKAHRHAQLGQYLRTEVKAKLQSTARQGKTHVGLSVPDVDGPALRVLPGASTTYTASVAAQHKVGDLDELLGVEWDVVSYPKNPLQCRYIASMKCRLAKSGAMECSLHIADGNFPFPPPSGHSYRDLITQDLNATAAAWELWMCVCMWDSMHFCVFFL